MRYRILKLLLVIIILPKGPAWAACAAELPDRQSAGDSVRMEKNIDTVSITAKRPTVIHSPVLGTINMGLTTMQKLPGLLGSADPLRTLQLMPGIQTTGEVSAGLYIRGSQSTHNLIELNGAPIYNAMHMLGIFSIFNDDNLDSFMLHKSYVPPRYGGHIGSVVSGEAKGTIPHRFSATGEIGLIASNLTLGVPLGTKSGLHLSARMSYIDPILKLIYSGDGTQLKYRMYDFNGTWILEPSAGHKIVVNAYHGNDKLSMDEIYDSDGGIKWGNTAGSVNWEYGFNSLHKLTQTFFATRYDNSIDLSHSAVSLSMPSSITDIGYKAVFEKTCKKLSWEYGLDYTYHRSMLQYPVFENYFFNNNPPDPVKTHEGGVFAEASLDISPAVKAKGGMRGSLLVHADKAYWAPEPRLNITVQAGTLSRISASAGIQQQYMNQVTTSNTGFPTDFWLPTSAEVPPQRAYSFSLGYSRETAGREYEFSAELYYKILTDQMESLSGMIDNFNSKHDIYDGIIYGKGRNYGLEVLLNKKYGRLSGWLSYTLGWAERSLDDIEGGRWFPMAYERRHDVSITAILRINSRWTVSSNFVYATGNSYTPTLGVYMIGEVAVNEYGRHNSARLPDYHRMDISASYEVRSGWFPGTLNISVYNLYARKNPIAFYTFVSINSEEEIVELKRRRSSLYSIIPSVSYSFRF